MNSIALIVGYYQWTEVIATSTPVWVKRKPLRLLLSDSGTLNSQTNTMAIARPGNGRRGWHYKKRSIQFVLRVVVVVVCG
jgi:hypothetical protein